MKIKPPFERRQLAQAASEFRVEDGATGPVIRGYAAKFNLPSEDLGGFVEFIAPGAFTTSVKECDVRALVDHNPTLILGRNKAGTLRLAEDEVGLKFECDLPDTQAARDLGVSIKRGDVSGCSFGFIVVEDAWHNEDGKVRRELKRVHLFDVSAVTFPAYPDTEVALRSFAAYRTTQAQQQVPAPTPLRDAAFRWLNVHSVA